MGHTIWKYNLNTVTSCSLLWQVEKCTSLWFGCSQENITINNQTGRLHVGPLDREVLGQSDLVQFTVLAVDEGTPSRTGVAMVTINVTGINDNKPVFSANNYTFEIDENNLVHTIVGQVSATDRDGDTLLYSIPNIQPCRFIHVILYMYFIWQMRAT